MKKIGLLLLALILVLGTMGCGTGKKGLQAGFGKTDISPEEGVELGSYGNSAARQNRGLWTELSAVSLVLTDAEDKTIVLIVTDLSWGNISRTEQIRVEVNKKLGIPKENVILAGTHNHSAPDPTSSNIKNEEYMEQWKDAVVQSVELAMADRKPATMEIGRTETENLVFSRRYERADGTFFGGGPANMNPQSNAPIVGHESEADEEIQMVKFVREEGKDILITNWQSHACNINDDRNKDFHYMASGEWPGVMRDCVEEELDVHCIYMQGAAGNMGCRSLIEGEFALEDPTDFEAIGQTLAGYVTKAYKEEGTFTPIESGLIKTNQYKMKVTKRDGTVVNQEQQKPELNTVAVGGLSLVTLPVELFDTSARWLKDETPYDMTLIMGYACGTAGYQAPEWAYEHSGYEVTNGEYEKGTAEKMMNHYLDTLKEFIKDE